MKSIIYKREASRLQKEILKHLKINVTIYLIGPIGSLLLTIFFHSLGLYSLEIIGFISIFIFTLITVGVVQYVQWISRIILYTLVKSKTELGSMNIIDNFNDILAKTKIIRKTIFTLYMSLNFTRLILKDSGKILLKEIFDIETKYFLDYLINLRSDLSLRLNEQQQSLESAKSEVESNIKGTAELNQVSELQKTRLDKQIEQFEELQKVLIKV